jgi:hypothetical protein
LPLPTYLRQNKRPSDFLSFYRQKKQKKRRAQPLAPHRNRGQDYCNSISLHNQKDVEKVGLGIHPATSTRTPIRG